MANDMPTPDWARAASSGDDLPVPAWAQAQPVDIPNPGFAQPMPPGYKAGAGGVPQYVGLDRGLRLGASGMAKGAASLLGLPGDLEWLARQSASRLGAPVDRDSTFLPNSADTVGVADRLGLTNRPELAPQNLAERLGSAAMGAIPGGELGVLTKMARVPSMIASQAGALAPAALDEVAPDINPWIKGGVGLAAALIGGRSASALAGVQEAGAGARTLQSATAALRDAKATHLGLTNDLATEGRAAAAAQRTLAASSENFRDTLISQSEAARDAAHAAGASGIAALRGAPMTAEEAGLAHQQAARQWMEKVPDLHEQNFSAANAAIPTSTPVGTDNLARILSQHAGEGAPEAWNQFINTIAPNNSGNLLRQLRAGGEGVAAGGDASMAQTLDWATANRLRKTVGDAMDNPTMVKGLHEAQLKQLYAGVNADMQKAADALGDVRMPGPTGTMANPGELYAEAMRRSDSLHTFNKDVIGKIISDPVGTADGAIRPQSVPGRIASMSQEHLTQLRNRLGQDALDPTYRASLSPQAGTGVPSWQKLRPEAQEALAPDAATRSALNSHHEAIDQATQGQKDIAASAGAAHKATLKEAADAEFDRAQRASGEAQNSKTRVDYLADQRADLTPSTGARAVDAANQGFHMLLGSHIGHDLGTIFGEGILGHGNTLQAGAAGEIAGALGPLALRHIGGALSSPRDLRYTGVGALGASPLVADSINRRKAGPRAD